MGTLMTSVTYPSRPSSLTLLRWRPLKVVQSPDASGCRDVLKLFNSHSSTLHLTCIQRSHFHPPPSGHAHRTSA